MYEQTWFSWGKPLADQSGEFLTYEKYCSECKKEGITPFGIHRFRTMMTMRGLRLSSKDEISFMRRV